MFTKLRSSITEMFSAVTLTPQPPPKVKGKSSAVPSYLQTATPSKTSALPLGDRRLASTDLTSTNRGQSTRNIVRQLAHSSPDISAAMHANIRAAITNSYTAVAKNTDGTFNREATTLLQQLLVRFDVLPDYSQGFTGTGSLRSISESLAKEIYMYGSMAGELVLGKDRLPVAIAPISTTKIEFLPDGNRLKPRQKVGGTYIDLDIPTFFYTALDQELLEAYSSSPIEAAIKPSLFSEQFMADLNRVIRRAISPRLTVKIDEEKFKENLPAEAMHDPEALQGHLDGVISSVTDMINGLEPEEALVYFDTIGIDLLNNGNTSLSSEYQVLGDMINAKMSTGAKTMPAILGHGAGSSNIASTETLLFMKSVEGAIQGKLNEFYSRILTLAVRLFGLDVYVEFAYAPIDLRPTAEMESFLSVKQSRLLELLSIGIITDEECALALTGYLPREGAPVLSGTFFKSAAGQANPGKDGSTNSGSTTNQKLNPDVPTQGKGQNNKANPQKTPQAPAPKVIQ